MMRPHPPTPSVEPLSARGRIARDRWLLVALGWAAAVLLLAAMTKANARTGFAWRGAVAIGIADASVWLVLIPALVVLGRFARARVARRTLRLGLYTLTFAPIAVGAAWLHTVVATATGFRRPIPIAAATFLYLDWNLAAFAAILSVGYALDRARTYASLTRRSLLLGMQASSARLDALTRQIHPHFLFNSLNSVAELADAAPERASRMLRQLRTLFDTTLRHTGETLVSVDEELASLGAYLAIERTRFHDRLTVELQVPAEVRRLGIPPFILQPLVENAIRHGLSREGEAGIVGIHGALDGRTLRLEVRDSGSIGQEDQSRRGFGIGLRNTAARLQRTFGMSARLEIRALGTNGRGTTVELSVPAQYPPAREEVPVAPASIDEDDIATSSPDSQAPSSLVRAIPLWLVVIGGWTLAWIFWAYQMHFFRVFRGVSIPILANSVADLLSAALWACFTPLILYFAARMRIDRPHLTARLAVHVLAAVLVSVLQMAIVQRTGLLRRGVFDPANLNQMILNALLYTLLVTWSHSRELARWLHMRQTETERSAADLAAARWQARALAIQPQMLVAALDDLAYRMDADPRDAEERVVSLAEILRRLLQRSGQEFITLNDEIDALRASIDLRALALASAPSVLDLTVAAERTVMVPSGLLRIAAGPLLDGDPPSDAAQRLSLSAATAPDAILLVIRVDGSEHDDRAHRTSAPVLPTTLQRYASRHGVTFELADQNTLRIRIVRARTTAPLDTQIPLAHERVRYA
jgi:two-component system, LytTR family, sensor kinase